MSEKEDSGPQMALENEISPVDESQLTTKDLETQILDENIATAQKNDKKSDNLMEGKENENMIPEAVTVDTSGQKEVLDIVTTDESNLNTEIKNKPAEVVTLSLQTTEEKITPEEQSEELENTENGAIQDAEEVIEQPEPVLESIDNTTEVPVSENNDQIVEDSTEMVEEEIVQTPIEQPNEHVSEVIETEKVTGEDQMALEKEIKPTEEQVEAEEVLEPQENEMSDSDNSGGLLTDLENSTEKKTIPIATETTEVKPLVNESSENKVTEEPMATEEKLNEVVEASGEQTSEQESNIEEEIVNESDPIEEKSNQEPIAQVVEEKETETNVADNKDVENQASVEKPSVQKSNQASVNSLTVMPNLVKKMNFDEISIEDTPPANRTESKTPNDETIVQDILEDIVCVDNKGNNLSIKERRRQENLKKLEMKKTGKLPLYCADYEPLPPPMMPQNNCNPQNFMNSQMMMDMNMNQMSNMINQMANNSGNQMAPQMNPNMGSMDSNPMMNNIFNMPNIGGNMPFNHDLSQFSSSKKSKNTRSESSPGENFFSDAHKDVVKTKTAAQGLDLLMEFMENNLHLLEGDKKRTEKLKSLTNSAKKILNRNAAQKVIKAVENAIEITPDKTKNAIMIDSSGSKNKKTKSQKQVQNRATPSTADAQSGNKTKNSMLVKRNPKNSKKIQEFEVAPKTVIKKKNSNFASEMIKKFQALQKSPIGLTLGLRNGQKTPFGNSNTLKVNRMQVLNQNVKPVDENDPNAINMNSNSNQMALETMKASKNKLTKDMNPILPKKANFKPNNGQQKKLLLLEQRKRELENLIQQERQKMTSEPNFGDGFRADMIADETRLDRMDKLQQSFGKKDLENPLKTLVSYENSGRSSKRLSGNKQLANDPSLNHLQILRQSAKNNKPITAEFIEQQRIEHKKQMSNIHNFQMQNSQRQNQQFSMPQGQQFIPQGQMNQPGMMRSQNPFINIEMDNQFSQNHHQNMEPGTPSFNPFKRAMPPHMNQQGPPPSAEDLRRMQNDKMNQLQRQERENLRLINLDQFNRHQHHDHQNYQQGYHHQAQHHHHSQNNAPFHRQHPLLQNQHSHQQQKQKFRFNDKVDEELMDIQMKKILKHSKSNKDRQRNVMSQRNPRGKFAKKPPVIRDGDWGCKGCGNINWARRRKCNMCQMEKDQPQSHNMQPIQHSHQHPAQSIPNQIKVVHKNINPCKKCGNMMRVGKTFCGFCGEVNIKKDTQNKQNSKQKFKKKSKNVEIEQNMPVNDQNQR